MYFTLKKKKPEQRTHLIFHHMIHDCIVKFAHQILKILNYIFPRGIYLTYYFSYKNPKVIKEINDIHPWTLEKTLIHYKLFD